MSNLIGHTLAAALSIGSAVFGINIVPKFLGLSQASSNTTLPPPDTTEETLHPQCRFYSTEDAFDAYEDCSYSTLRFMTVNNVDTAIERAQSCATPYGEKCILSHEVDFDVPTAFVWDHENLKMRPIIAPAIVENGTDTHRVTIVSPIHDVNTIVKAQRPDEFLMHSTVKVEHIQYPSLRPTHEWLTGYDSYCVQLLRISIGEECARSFGMER